MNKLLVLRKVTLYSVLTVVLFGGIFFIGLAIQASKEKTRLFTVIANYNLGEFLNTDEYQIQKGDMLSWDSDVFKLQILRKEDGDVYKVLDTISNPKEPENNKYNFVGWGLTKDTKVDVESNTVKSWTQEITEDITLYAIWLEKSEPPQIVF